MADDNTPPRIGRPPGTTRGVTPIRHLRVGQIWNDCAKQAKTDGQSMSEFVRDAITRELDRRRAASRTAVVPGIRCICGPHPAYNAECPVCGHGPAAAPQCPACTSPYPHHRFALANPDGDGPAWCDHEWHDAVTVAAAPAGWRTATFDPPVPVAAGTSYVTVYTTPGARHCRCDFLGPDTPVHDASALCVSLRPDAGRDPEQAPAARPFFEQVAEVRALVEDANAVPRLVDGNHYDTACDDRPDCTIAEHHADD